MSGFSGTVPLVGSFEVDRNGTDQTGLTATIANKITWTTANINNQSWFSLATGKYIPLVAGTYVAVLGTVTLTGTLGETCQAFIYKNGSPVKAGDYLQQTAVVGAAFTSYIMATIPMNGSTDFLEAYAYLPAAVTTLKGNTDRTHFQGWRIDA